MGGWRWGSAESALPLLEGARLGPGSSCIWQMDLNAISPGWPFRKSFSQQSLITFIPRRPYSVPIRACERSAAQFPLPAQEDVRSFALPLNVVPGRSAQNRSALILNFLPLRRNRSTLRSNFSRSTSQTPSCYSRGHTSQCCGGGGMEGSHVTRFIQSGCLDAPIETHSILREPPTCKPLEAVKMGADWSGVKSPLRPLNLKPLCAPTRSNLFLPLRSTTRSTLRSAHMLWLTSRNDGEQPVNILTFHSLIGSK